jgi:hypothetical protein
MMTDITEIAKNTENMLMLENVMLEPEPSPVSK